MNEESNGINAGAEIVAFNFNLEGHVFYVMTLPDIGETYAYDCQTQTRSAPFGIWSETIASPSSQWDHVAREAS